MCVDLVHIPSVRSRVVSLAHYPGDSAIERALRLVTGKVSREFLLRLTYFTAVILYTVMVMNDE